LPQASVARQLRVAAKVFPQRALVVVLRIVTVALPHRSLAVGASNVQAVPHSMVLAGAQVIVGAVVSRTVTVWLHWAVLSQASVAFHVRVAMKVLPHAPLALVMVERTVRVTVELPQVLEAVGRSKVQAAAHSTLLSVAQTMVTVFVGAQTSKVWTLR